jgi:hypothetical protein
VQKSTNYEKVVAHSYILEYNLWGYKLMWSWNFFCAVNYDHRGFTISVIEVRNIIKRRPEITESRPTFNKFLCDILNETSGLFTDVFGNCG